jgi:Protein of unknown function (DUF4199)
MKNLKTEIKYAVFSAIALVLWVLIEHLLGFNTSRMEIGEYTQPIIAIVVLIFLFFGIREKRNKDFGGTLTFLQGLKTAFFISLFYALLQGLWFAVYSKIINPEYATLLFQFQEKQLAAAGKTPEQIVDEMAMAKMIFGNVAVQFVFFILSTTTVNTVVGAIMTLFLKKKAKA